MTNNGEDDRLAERRLTNGELAKAKRLNTQIPIVEKRSPPDYITRNEGSLNDTRNQARKKEAESRCF